MRFLGRWLAALMLTTRLAAAAPGTAAEVPAVAAETEPEVPTWHRDEQGRAFRVRFDPGSRFTLGWSYTPRWSPGTLTLDAASLETGVAYRHIAEQPDSDAAWKIYHEALQSRVQVLPAVSRLSTTLYTGRYLHWTRDGRLVLPTNPPQYLPFPLNVGFETAVGTVEYADAPVGFGAEIGVARAEIVLDVWRQRRLGSYAQFGLGPTYEIWVDQRAAHEGEPGGPVAAGADDSTDLQVAHVVAPFTRGSFAFHHESADGHHVVDAQIAGGYALGTTFSGSAGLQAQGGYEAILIGVNDLPLSAYVAVRYRYEQAPRPAGETHELGAAAGLRLGIVLDE